MRILVLKFDHRSPSALNGVSKKKYPRNYAFKSCQASTNEDPVMFSMRVRQTARFVRGSEGRHHLRGHGGLQWRRHRDVRHGPGAGEPVPGPAEGPPAPVADELLHRGETHVSPANRARGLEIKLEKLMITDFIGYSMETFETRKKNMSCA